MNLVLRRDVTRLRTVHRRRVEREGAADVAPPFDAKQLSQTVLQQARLGFGQLLATEYESVVIAGWMTAGLARIGAPLDLVGAFGKVVEDEVRHTDIMCQVMEQLHGTPEVNALPLPPKAETIAGAAAVEEVLGGLAAFFCVGEEISSHIFKAAMQLASEPLLLWATSEIFRDEATHGAFGFETARELLRGLPAPAKQRVGARVTDAITQLERRLGGPLREERAPTADERALAALGLLPTPALLSIFYTELEASVLPRLADAGLPLQLGVTR